MSENIPLTKDGGLDPRLTYCRRCGGECNEIIVGDNRLLKNPTTGQTALAPRDKVRTTAKELGWGVADYTVEEVPEGKLPATNYCDSCEKEVAEFEKIVADGGVYWRCCECEKEGVIAKSKFADSVREHAKVPVPDPCGVEFVLCEEHLTDGA